MSTASLPLAAPALIVRYASHMLFSVKRRSSKTGISWIRTISPARTAIRSTMDTAFAEMPDALWLKRVLPEARVVMRSNSRLVQAEFCRQGSGLAVSIAATGRAWRAPRA
jgi:hypothetical protein